MPPLTFNPTPVMYDARSEQRNAIAFATSCGSPARRIAVALHHALVHLRIPEVEGLCADDAGHDRIARDPVPCPLERERARQPEETRLRRRVARLPEAAERPRNGRHVHDPAPAAFLHVRPDGLGAVERAGQVHAQVPLPELRHLVGELAEVVERAGVVDEDVDCAELVDRPAARSRRPGLGRSRRT